LLRDMHAFPTPRYSDLNDASRRFVQEGKLQQEINTALACADRDSLAAHFKNRYNVTLPDFVLRLEGQERDDAIRARVESILRAEDRKSTRLNSSHVKIS